MEPSSFFTVEVSGASSPVPLVLVLVLVPVQCSGCGHRHEGGSSRCLWREHPNWNDPEAHWAESASGVAYKSEFGRDELISSKTLEDTADWEVEEWRKEFGKWQ